MNSILISLIVIASLGMAAWGLAEIARWLAHKMRPLELKETARPSVTRRN